MLSIGSLVCQKVNLKVAFDALRPRTADYVMVEVGGQLGVRNDVREQVLTPVGTPPASRPATPPPQVDALPQADVMGGLAVCGITSAEPFVHDNVTFTVLGFVAVNDGHAVAYVQRDKGWELHDSGERRMVRPSAVPLGSAVLVLLGARAAVLATPAAMTTFIVMPPGDRFVVGRAATDRAVSFGPVLPPPLPAGCAPHPDVATIRVEVWHSLFAARGRRLATYVDAALARCAHPSDCPAAVKAVMNDMSSRRRAPRVEATSLWTRQVPALRTPCPVIATANCMSLNRTACDALLRLVTSATVDVLLLTEIWQPTDDVKAVLAHVGLRGVFTPRTSRGGGTAILALDPWRVEPLTGQPPEPGGVEVTRARLFPPGGGSDGIVIGAVYAPPETATADLLEHAMCFTDSAGARRRMALVGGDWNAVSSTWSSGQPNAHGSALERAAATLHMCLRTPTDATTVRGTVVDFFATGPGCICSEPRVAEKISDHHAVVTRLGVGAFPELKRTSRRVLALDAVPASKLEEFRSRLGVAISAIDPAGTADAQHDAFVAALRRATAVLPWRRVSSVRAPPAMCWRDPAAALRRQIATLDARALWRVFDRGRPPDVQPPGLAEYFAAGSRTSVPNLVPPPPPTPPEAVTPAEVVAAIWRHNSKGCADPDDITPRLLRILPPDAHAFLARLFSRASSGEVPMGWKRATIVALPKPGRDPTLHASWRPVALTSLISRTWERVVTLRLERLVDTSLHKGQFGYRRYRSSDQLLSLLRAELSRAIAHKEKLQTGARPTRSHIALVLALDASSAFNACSVDGLVEELVRLGVPEVAGIAAWLRQRSQTLRGDPGTRSPPRRGAPRAACSRRSSGPSFWTSCSRRRTPIRCARKVGQPPAASRRSLTTSPSGRRRWTPSVPQTLCSDGRRSSPKLSLAAAWRLARRASSRSSLPRSALAAPTPKRFHP
jgi:hypothetical protein